MHMPMTREQCHMAGARPTYEEALHVVLEECLAHPDVGLNSLRARLKARGILLGAKSLRAILESNGLWDKQQRWLELEKRLQAGQDMSRRQLAFLATRKSMLCRQEPDCARPGERLHQGVFLAGLQADQTRIYLHAAVDAYSACAFARLELSRQANGACRLLDRMVLPYFHQRGLRVEAVVTGRLQTFRGTSRDGYPHFLKNGNIAHELRGRGERSRLLEQFVEAAKRECLHAALSPNNAQAGLYEAEQALRDWLRAYNEQRPMRGFPHKGRPPLALLEGYLE